MRRRLAGTVRSRIFSTLMLVLLLLSLGGAAFGFKSNYIPGPVSAANRHDQPLGGHSSHADFEQDCKHCHAPVRCLSANLCQDCHREIARQRVEAVGLHGMLPGTDKCQACHIEHQGRDATICNVPFASINHQQLAGYFLDGHQSNFDGSPLTCDSCHPGGRHDATSDNCTRCHAAEDAEHMAAHADQYGSNCIGCHDGQDRMIGFEHDEVYVLDGAHQGIDCTDCHPGLTFTGAVRGCADCHDEPEVHTGETGLHCDWCHTPTAWSPAQLTEHVFRLDHGDQGELDCETCHTGSYVSHTCYGCHDHQPAEMEELHAQEEIDQLEPCGQCHPTGAKDEAAQARYDA